jgi:hypothetical protein
LKFDAGTVLLQWAVGGLAFLWVTTRRREVGVGYGWLMRSVFGALAVGGALLSAGAVRGTGLAVAGAALVALVVSIARRRAGVRGEHERSAARSARVAAMVGNAPLPAPAVELGRGVEFPPALDAIAPVVGLIALLFAASAVGGPYALSALRIVAGAAFLGAVTDAMLLGHWYLVQPGLDRAALRELTRAVAIVWPIEVVALLLPTGMVSVFTGAVDDGWHGLLGWMWLVCALTTIGLVAAVWAALRERYYSAVMAATGLLYLAILTAFGTDLVARAVLAGH